MRAVVKVEAAPGEEDRMWFVGIDVSKATFDAAALSNNGEIDRQSVRNIGPGHTELVRWLLSFDSPPVALETTSSYHRHLVTALQAAGVGVSVIKPTYSQSADLITGGAGRRSSLQS